MKKAIAQYCLLRAVLGLVMYAQFLIIALVRIFNNQFTFIGAAETSVSCNAKEALNTIAAAHDNITFVPVVEQAEGWSGKTGNVLQAVKEDFTSLAEMDIYIAGRFEMAGAAREQFTTEKQAKVEHLFGDAFAFI